MSSIMSEISLLNEQINAAHLKHYETSKTGLHDPQESPNGNTMYHLYSNGKLTFQKGGDAYLKRSEFESQPYIIGYEKLGFEFVKKTRDASITYVILTGEECWEYRKKMVDMVKTL